MNTRKFNGNAREHQPPWEHGGFWKRFDRERREEMERESEIMKTENEEWHTKGYELGIVVAHEGLVASFKEKAGKAFALGQRNAADLLMETASDIEKTAKQLRADYWKKYPITPAKTSDL